MQSSIVESRDGVCFCSRGGSDSAELDSERRGVESPIWFQKTKENLTEGICGMSEYIILVKVYIGGFSTA